MRFASPVLFPGDAPLLSMDSAPVGWRAMVAQGTRRLGDYSHRLHLRSAIVTAFLTRRIGAIAWAWIAVIAIASIPKILFPATPVHNLGDLWPIVLPYVLIALAPIAGYSIAAGSFPRGGLIAQPSFRLALYGRWRRVSVLEARQSSAFGPTGFMASLLVGMLLNVVVRSFEFLLAMPAMNHHAPEWGVTLFLLMAADVIVMSFFYMVCFVMALRTVPLFPRMLLFAWGLDIAAQLLIAEQVSAMHGLPAPVAASLRDLLEGNIDKVLISALVWLPYLLLSERVNLTYRQRVARTA